MKAVVTNIYINLMKTKIIRVMKRKKCKGKEIKKFKKKGYYGCYQIKNNNKNN
jgi:hypothetical protein